MLKSYLTNIYGVIKMNKIETRLNTEENNERYNPNINDGLNEEQIQARKLQNLINYDTTVPTKSIKSIILCLT